MIPIYYGVFVPCCGGTLDKVVIFQHVTFGFRMEYPKELGGMPVDIKVVGYGNNGCNEAYQVEIPDNIAYAYNGASVSHITLSTCRSGKPVDSWKLDFKPIEPFVLKGVFGYYAEDNMIHME